MSSIEPDSKIQNIEIDEFHDNTNQELIQITKDKLHIKLINYITNVEKRKEWITPLSLVVTIITVLSTSTFEDSLKTSKHTWKAIFVIILIASIIWLICSLIKMKRSLTIEELIDNIKKNK